MLMLAVLQANVGRGSVATSQIVKFADRQKIDIIMLQEPYTRNDRVAAISNEFTVLESNRLQPTSSSTSSSTSHPSSQSSSQQSSNLNSNHLSSPHRPKAACLIRNNQSNYLLDQELSHVNMVVVAFDHAVLVSLYSNAKHPDKSNRPMTDDLESIDRVISKYRTKRIAVFMDSNCHHGMFGGEQFDERGEQLVQFAQERDLIWANEPDQGATYSKTVNGKEQATYIDLTLMNKKMSERLHSWSVVRKVMSTEHAAIVAKFECGQKREATFKRQIIDYRASDWDGFFTIYHKNKPERFERKGFEKQIKKFNKAIRRAFNKCVKVKERTYYDSIPWYSEKLERMQKQIM